MSWLIFSKIAVAFFVVGLIIFLFQTKAVMVKGIPTFIFLPTFTPTPTPFTTYVIPKIAKKDYYRIVMVGDSMTQVLSIHGGELSDDLNTLFQSTPGHQKILIDNYAVGGKNITQIESQMQNATDQLPALLSSDFDMILIESCGYNPLSSLGIDNGLKKQSQTLLDLVQLLLRTHPKAAIVFVATVAPNKETYAEDEGLKTIAERTAEANERSDYIKNHMAFANTYHIPLIDIYSPSLISNGDGNLKYINPGDHIHPSQTGVDFIASTIANYIYNSSILPK